MTQAEVHYALAMDRELWQASQVDPSLLDPIVRVGSLPGTSRPIAVVRDYQGPQGSYLESFRIKDAAGRLLYQSVPGKIQLTGEQFTDRVATVLPGLELVRGDEHTVTFTLGDEDVAAIPMFVEVGEGGDPAIAAKETFAKALGKGNVLWLVVPPGGNGAARRPKRKVPRRGLTPTERQQPAWYVQQGDRVYVLTGPSEQQIAGLANASTVEIVARSKEHRSQVSRVPATARVVPGDDPLFERVAQAGLGRRLNLPDGEAALERWRATCTLVELTPDFAALTGHGGTSFGGGGGGAAATAAAGRAAAGPAAATAEGAPAAAPAKAKRPEDEIHVEAQVDQAVFDKLIAEGKSERVARAQAKAAYVRAEKARILAERGGGDAEAPASGDAES